MERGQAAPEGRRAAAAAAGAAGAGAAAGAAGVPAQRARARGAGGPRHRRDRPRDALLRRAARRAGRDPRGRPRWRRRDRQRVRVGRGEGRDADPAGEVGPAGDLPLAGRRDRRRRRDVLRVRARALRVDGVPHLAARGRGVGAPRRPPRHLDHRRRRVGPAAADARLARGLARRRPARAVRRRPLGRPTDQAARDHGDGAPSHGIFGTQGRSGLRLPEATSIRRSSRSRARSPTRRPARCTTSCTWRSRGSARRPGSPTRVGPNGTTWADPAKRHPGVDSQDVKRLSKNDPRHPDYEDPEEQDPPRKLWHSSPGSAGR